VIAATRFNGVGHADQASFLGEKVQNLISPVLVGSDEEPNGLGDVARRNFVARPANARSALRANGPEELFLGAEAADYGAFSDAGLGGHVLKRNLVVANLSEQPASRCLDAFAIGCG